MRLVGSVVGSAILLGEPVSGLQTWAGLGIVASTVTLYAHHKHKLRAAEKGGGG